MLYSPIFLLLLFMTLLKNLIVFLHTFISRDNIKYNVVYSLKMVLLYILGFTMMPFPLPPISIKLAKLIKTVTVFINWYGPMLLYNNDKHHISFLYLLLLTCTLFIRLQTCSFLITFRDIIQFINRLNRIIDFSSTFISVWPLRPSASLMEINTCSAILIADIYMYMWPIGQAVVT